MSHFNTCKFRDQISLDFSILHTHEGALTSTSNQHIYNITSHSSSAKPMSIASIDKSHPITSTYKITSHFFLNKANANFSPPPGLEMSAQEFVDESEFQSHVLDAICKASEPQESIFTDVKSSWGESVVNLINETADGRSTR